MRELSSPTDLTEITEHVAALLHREHPDWWTTGPVFRDDEAENVSFLIQPFDDEPGLEVVVALSFREDH